MKRSWTLPLVLVSAAALAAPARPDLTMRGDDYLVRMQSECLASGLRVILQEDHDRPIVSVHTVYDGGSRADADGRDGTAHLAEHLWFDSRHEGVAVETALQSVGATWNGHTTADYVSFETSAPAEALPTLMRLEALRVTEPLAGLVDDDVAVEREVVKDEQRLGLRPLFRTADAELAKALFPAGHPYAHGAETAATVDAIRLQDAQQFTAAHWRPRDTTLVVVGDFTLDDAWRAIAGAFPKGLLTTAPTDMGAPLCSPRVPLPRPEPPKPASTETKEVTAAVDHPYLVVAWTLPGGWRDDAMDMEAASTFLGWVIQDRVASMDTTTGLANPASCWLDPEPQATTLACAVEVDEKRPPERALHLVKVATLDLRDPAGPTAFAKPLGDVYNDIRRSLFEGLEDFVSLDGRGADVALHAHFTASPTWARDNLASLEKMTPERVSKLFQTYVTDERMAVLIVRPNGVAGDAVATDVEAPRGLAVSPGDVGRDVLARRLALPDLSKIQASTLPNGMRVVVLPYGSAPRVRAGLVLPGGEWSAPAPGVDTLTWDVTKLYYTWNTFSLFDAPRTFLGDWGSRSDGWGKVVRLSGASGNLDGVMWCLRDLVDHVEAQASLKRGWVATETSIEAARAANADWHAYDVALARVLPGVRNPYPHASDMDAVSAADVKAWHARVWQPANATLVVVGKLDPAAATKLASADFADWKGSGQPVPDAPKPVTADAADRQVVFVPADRAQATTTLYCATSAGQDGRVLAAVLEDAAWEQLRERHGLTYDVRGTIDDVAGQGVLTLRTSTVPDAAGTVVGGWFDLLSTTATSAKPDDVARAELDVARDERAAWDDADAAFGTLAFAIRSGQDVGSLAKTADELAAVDVAAVEAQAKRCAGHEVVTVVGPESAKDALVKAGITPAAP